MIRRWKRLASSGLLAKREQRALPVTREELEILAAGLEAEGRKYGGLMDWSGNREWAQQLRRRGGVALALGHEVVPIVEWELPRLKAAASSLVTVLALAETAETFLAVVRMLDERVGMACVREWAVQRSDAGMHWSAVPAEDDLERLGVGE